MKGETVVSDGDTDAQAERSRDMTDANLQTGYAPEVDEIAGDQS